MNEFEYVTFELSDYKNSPALRYQKICKDFDNEMQFSYSAFLKKLKTEMESTYSDAELEITEQVQLDFWVQRLAKQMAVEMIVSGKTTPDTMKQAIALPDDDFKRTVMLCKEMAHKLDVTIKESESNYDRDTHVVDQRL